MRSSSGLSASLPGSSMCSVRSNGSPPRSPWSVKRILDGLERHYAREQLYPDSLEELVAAGDLDALPSPAIGFRSLGGADFHYQNFGTSYLLDFAAPRWVECAYSPPYAEEEEEDDDGADEALGGSWSCPAEPPELW